MLNFKMQAQKHTERENKAVPGKRPWGCGACHSSDAQNQLYKNLIKTGVKPKYSFYSSE